MRQLKAVLAGVWLTLSFSLSAAATPVTVPDQTPVSLAGDLQTHDATVGNLNGSAGVSGGAASYDIPIALPPGRNGMQPSVSLSYSSRAGNGIAGRGWSLSASSSVHRCPQTLEQDGQIVAVSFTNSDRLCLDGERLVLTSTNTPYGSSGAVYATEIDSFARITQLGGDLTSATSYFKVELKSGETVYYGGTSTAASASRVVPGGIVAPLSWSIERKVDRVGNLIRYAYTNYGNAEVLLNSILYTGFQAADGDRHVDFSYEARPVSDLSSSYLAGGLSRQTMRLSAITTWAGSEKVFNYQFGYTISQASGASLLSTATQCAFNGTSSVCHRPTTFGWQGGVVKRNFESLQSALAGALSPGETITSLVGGTADYNGDGSKEFIAAITNANDASLSGNYLVSINADRQITGPKLAMPSTLMTIVGGGYSYEHPADFNHDGKDDIVSIGTDGAIQISAWTGPDNAATAAQAFTTVTVFAGNAYSPGSPYPGDFNGDGWADLAFIRRTGFTNSACTAVLTIFLNQKNTSSPLFAQSGTSHCMSVAYGSTNESIYDIQDLNGDGLSDILISRATTDFSSGASTFLIDRILMSSVTSAGYAYQVKSLSSYFTSADSRTAMESNARLTWQLTDVNGDGLSDFLYARPVTVSGVDTGYWTVRLNTGKEFGPRINTTSNAGIEVCAGAYDSANYSSYCKSVWAARNFTRQLDADGDGVRDLLIQARFASRLCLRHNRAPGEPEYYCPERPDLSGYEFENGYVNNIESTGMYRSGWGQYDPSVYWMDQLKFELTAPGSMTVIRTATQVTATRYGRDNTRDYFGDGLDDNVFYPASCLWPCSRLSKDASGRVLTEAESPSTLPNGDSVSALGVYISEARGVGDSPNIATPESPDRLAMVTDGLGKQTLWTYYPLSSKAGRTATDTPLYSIPEDASNRYIDDRHVYFTSSMQVVSEMSESDGLGNFRTWSYGYSEAMYNDQGRGFQGFHKITVEDEANQVRTTTLFNQKYPLTGQIDQVIVNSMHRIGTDAPFSTESYTWRCNRADRTDTTACAVTPGSNPVRFPYLDTKETHNYDIATAESPTGTPKEISYQLQVNAKLIKYQLQANPSDSTCVGFFGAPSGFDTYGNLIEQTTLTYDSGDGTPGYKPYVSTHCVRTSNTFATADTANWWLDKLTQRDATTSNSYDAANHPLPSGTGSPTQTVTTTYTWNTNRTPATETVQNGVANQQRVTTYAYPVSNNYGLPSSVTVVASGDQNSGGRVASTTYSADGYFPYIVTDALGHQVATTVRARDGQPSLNIDANGERTTIQYDVFGLPIKTMFRGQATDTVYRAPDKNVALSWCNGGCDPGASAIYQTTEEQDGAPTKTVSYDVLGRPLVSAQRLMDGTLTHTQTQYNARGLTAQQSEPYTTGTPVWTQFTNYDGTGRLTRKLVPKQLNDGRGDLVTTYTYVGRTTNILVCGSNDVGTTPCLSLSRSTDSLGRYEETSDALGGITQFWYDGAGNALALQDAKNTLTKASYNALGQRTQVIDPNQGTSNFTYNAIGEVLSQTDARGITNAFTYDKGGRKIGHTATIDINGDAVADAIVDSWIYDPLNGVGALGQSKRQVNGLLVKQVDTSYDALARPIQTVTQQGVSSTDTRTYTSSTQYDTYYGRPKGQTYPTGDTVRIEYSNYGDPFRSSDASTGALYKTVNSENARNQPVSETLGVLTRSYAYAATTGQSTQIKSALGATVLRTLDYQYDVFGNIRQQILNATTVEAFTYDKLHRLTQSTRSGGATGTVTYGFDAVGNINFKSDFSTTAANAYTYAGGACGGGPNAVKSVVTSTGTRTYCYDASGNLTADSAGLAVKYDEFNHPWATTRGASVDTFSYGPNGERIRQAFSDGNRVIVDNLEVDLSNGQTKLYLGKDVVITALGATRTVQYLLTDRLGSVDAVASAAGAITETRGYDAFGAPRLGTWADASPPRLQDVSTTRKGFTEHEHLNAVELIHMDGRVYDYRLGRFLSVDPFIQAPLNSQSLNPYSYIMNNPLSGTDPTGYACATGTHITGDSGWSCSDLGVMGGRDDEGDNFRPSDTRRDKQGNGAQNQSSSAPKAEMDVDGSVTWSSPYSNSSGSRHYFGPDGSPNDISDPRSPGSDGATTYALGKGPSAEQPQLGELEYQFSMTTSQTGIDFIKGWEGWNGTLDRRLGKWVAKDDGFGNGTIGWGHNCGKCEDFENGITKQEGNALLKNDLERFERSVNTLRMPLHQQQFDSLVDFAFNIRSYAGSTLFKNVKSGEVVTRENFTAYGHARVAGRLVEIPSLMQRRRSEYDTYDSGTYDSSH